MLMTAMQEVIVKKGAGGTHLQSERNGKNHVREGHAFA